MLGVRHIKILRYDIIIVKVHTKNDGTKVLPKFFLELMLMLIRSIQANSQNLIYEQTHS